MINQIKKCLLENPKVTDWLIHQVSTDSHQAFYVMQKLETTRLVQTEEYTVTVYTRFIKDEIEYLGSSSFAIFHKLSKKELSKLIDDAVFAASFIKNKAYNLVIGAKKRSWKDPKSEIEPFELLENIAKLFILESTENIRFNSLELFHTSTTTRVVNSRSVDLKKTTNKVFVESIPSYDGEGLKVELYKPFTYLSVDYDLIKNDAANALCDVKTRYLATKIQDVSLIDVILKDLETSEFFETLIEDYSYTSVYKQNTDKVIGDSIQKDIVGDRINIGYVPSSKANAFDGDGIILKNIQVITDGILTSFYGKNQYAQYLNLQPSGDMDMISVQKGSAKYAQMTKKTHIEILALSGIQIDMYSGYIGGEVRLALYFDGKNKFPVSGFSFSGNINTCLSSITISKEMTKLARYIGPKYIKLTNMKIL